MKVAIALLYSTGRVLERFGEWFPFTLLGLALLVLGVTGFYYLGIRSFDFVVRAGAVTAGAVLVVDLLLVLAGELVSRHRVRAVLTLSMVQSGDGDSVSAVPMVMTANRWGRTGLEFRGLRLWPLVDISMQWLEPAGVDARLKTKGLELAETVVFHERGRADHITRRFTVSDPFGIVRISFRVGQAASITVQPDILDVRAIQDFTDTTGEGYSHPLGKPVGDYVEVRPYVWGDPLRLVVWKAFARTHKLLVREPERSYAPRHMVGVYFVAGPGDEPSAAAARSFVEKRLPDTGYLFMADGAVSPVNAVDQVIDQLIDSITFRDRGGTGLEHFWGVLNQVPVSAMVMFVPPIPGRWMDPVKAFAHKLGVAPVFITGIDFSLVNTSARTGHQGRRMRMLKDVYSRLSGVAGQFLVVHYPTGQVVSGRVIGGFDET